MNCERKKTLIQLIVGAFGSIAGLFCVVAVNQNLLMSLPISARMVLMIISYWVIALVPLIIMLVGKDYFSDHGFSKKKIGNQVMAGLIIGLCMSLVFTLVPIFLGKGDWVDNGHHYKYLWQFIFEFVYCIIAVGFVEEYVFRGFIFSKLKTLSGSVTVAIVVSSIFFGVFHLLAGNIVQMIVTGIMGAFFCICREKIENSTLLSLIIAHGVYDALITVWASVL